MKITHVAVEGVGRFGRPARIAGLGPGLNILAAGNEAGKSTLFRAIRTCLFERHGTRNSDVMAMASDGLALPIAVTLGFEHGGTAYEIAKSFVRSPQASLRRAGTEIARNREADEKVWEILGIDHGGGRAVDDAAFGILWVGQGQSFAMPNPQGAAADTFNAAIQAEVGTLVGGERARHVLAAVQRDLSRLVTDGGRPRAGGPLAEASRQADELARDLGAVEARLRELDANLDELARVRGDLARLADPAEKLRLRDDLDEARRSLQAGEEAAAALQRLEQDEHRAQALLASQTEALDSIHARRRRIDASRGRQGECTAALEPLEADEVAARREAAAAHGDIQRIDAELDALDGRDRALQRAAAIAIRAAGRAGRQDRLDAVRDYHGRLLRAEAELAANSADAAATEALDGLERDIATLSARIDAAAARLTIERRGGPPVTLGGEPVESHVARAVSEPLVIAVGDAVTISIAPPPGAAAAQQQQMSELRHKLVALFRRHGVATAAELRARRAARLAVEDVLRGLKAERALLGLAAAPAEEIASLEAELTGIDRSLEELRAEQGDDELLPPDRIEDQRQALHQQRQALRSRRSHVEAVVTARNQAIAGVLAQRGTLQGQLAEIGNQLAADLAVLPDDRSEAIVGSAEALCRQAADDHRLTAALLAENRRHTPPAEEIDRRRSRVDRLTEAGANRDRQSEALARRVAHLEGQIETAGGDGLGERAAELRGQHAVAVADLARHTDRVATLTLLRDAVETSYGKRRDQLHAPLRRHLRPFLGDVFPSAEIELGDGFKVTALRRDGPGSELIGRLSAGTQEQIAVLVRLAMGAMIAERGDPVPVILDDALVFSDDDRIEQMFDALKRAARHHQVIIFTCRSRTFASLGGTQLHVDG